MGMLISHQQNLLCHLLNSAELLPEGHTPAFCLISLLGYLKCQPRNLVSSYSQRFPPPPSVNTAPSGLNALQPFKYFLSFLQLSTTV